MIELVTNYQKLVMISIGWNKIHWGRGKKKWNFNDLFVQ